MERKSWVSVQAVRAALLAVAGGAVAVTGCSKGNAEAPESAEQSANGPEGARDFIKLDPGSPRLDFIKIEVVKESSRGSEIALPGRVTFDEDHTQRVASPIDGRVVGILVKPGDKVRAGQALIELSSPQVGQLQSDALKALSDLSVAQKAIDRAHKLQVDGAISEKEVAQTEGDFRKAKSDYARASAQLKSLGVTPGEPAVNVSLRAQIPGVVVERNVLAGQEVRADQAMPLLTISSLDVVWVLGDVYEQDLSAIEPGSTVNVSVPAYPGQMFAGTVKHIGDVVDANSRTVKVRCTVANPDHRLKPEMFAKVIVQNVGGRKFIAVPSKAVLSDGETSVVVVATEGNVFKARKVEVGPDNNGTVRILAGLTAGEKIVTDGAIFMKKEVDRR
ncbi:MAG TPA: efflux RND transporter periplasmic adaptor subunit [Polyangia bacterium]|jgi:cobalt-zinc-cadmium efflux system membrane fusion protein